MSPPGRRLLGILLVTASLALAMLAGGALGAPGDGPVATLTWPWPGPDTANLTEAATAAIHGNATEPLLLGEDEIERFEIRRVDVDRVSVTVSESDEVHEVVQPHEPPTDGASDDLSVRPSQLNRAVVEIHPKGVGGPTVLVVSGPPGAFDLTVPDGHSGPEVVGNARSYAESLGLATDDAGDPVAIDWSVVSRGPGEAASTRFAPLYPQQDRCLTDACETETKLRLRCECVEVRGEVQPAPAREVTNRSDGAVEAHGGSNVLRLLFDAEDRLVHAQVHAVYDLDAEAVANPATARSRVVDALREEGVVPVDSQGTASKYEVLRDEDALTRVSLEVETGYRVADLADLQYVWRSRVEATNDSGEDAPARAMATVSQNASTGEVRAVSLDAAGGHTPTQEAWFAPGPGALGLLTLASAAALLGRRRSG